MTERKTEEQIAQFIESELLEGAAPGSDPLAAGMLDSLSVEVLIAWLEDEFEISLITEMSWPRTSPVWAPFPRSWTPND